MAVDVLRVRWLGRVSYDDADVLQRGLHARARDDYLLLLEHPHVYTLGTRASLEHVLVPPETVGADLVHVDRGGDVTYHGPGQLVGYPIINLPEWRDGQSDVVAYVRALEDVLIAALADLGVSGDRRAHLTGVWVGDEKVAAIGVKVARGRTRHGFALNVDPDLSMFDHIIPCGIADKGVTSLARLLGDTPTMRVVRDTVVARFAERFDRPELDRQDVFISSSTTSAAASSSSSGHVHGHLASLGGPRTEREDRAVPVRLLGRLTDAGVDAPEPGVRRPEWMRVKANLGAEYRATRRLMRSLDLTTVCEEAGCPNIYECWADRTATFMILGERCTRACGFCLVDTRKPQPTDEGEPARVADAVATLGLQHVVVTSVARDDLSDGGASGFVATIAAIRGRAPGTRVEVLVPDCKGDRASLDALFGARPDVLNHNLETVARLQRAARPSAGYARSLAVLARAKDAGLVTKSGLIVGMGETTDEVRAAITDLRNVGVDLLTVGQYLQPSARHLPVVRWWTPAELRTIGEFAEGLGFAHVEAGPLVRSSYHAKRADEAASDGASDSMVAPAAIGA